MMKAVKVYIAGPYTPHSTNGAVEMLGNIRQGIRMSLDLIHLGFAPFCPWLDFLYWVSCPEEKVLTYEQIINLSLVYVEGNEAVLMLPRWESSAGAQKERQHALDLDIPVFYSVEELCEHFKVDKKTP
jgi:hypothetical protein